VVLYVFLKLYEVNKVVLDADLDGAQWEYSGPVWSSLVIGIKAEDRTKGNIHPTEDLWASRNPEKYTV
jgi:hypothetical protein